MKSKEKIKELEKRIEALESALQHYWLTPNYPFQIRDDYLKPPYEITCNTKFTEEWVH